MENGKPANAEIELKPEKKNRKGLYFRIVIIFLLLDALGGVYWYVLSPQAVARRTVKKIAAAFEKKEQPKLMGCISESYTDNYGNTRADFDSALGLLFSKVDKLEARIDRITVTVKDGVAVAAINGRISYTYKGVPHRTNYNEAPFVMRLQREGGMWNWRVTTIDDVGGKLSDMEMLFKEVESF